MRIHRFSLTALAATAFVIGYPCFRLKVIGHYFALVTLALSQVVMLSIVAARDITTNLPYVPGCHLAFDHHSSELTRNGERRPATADYETWWTANNR